MNDDTLCRILDDDDLITLDKTREILGGMSVATAYEDPDLMALKIKMTAESAAPRRYGSSSAKFSRCGLSASSAPKPAPPKSGPRSRPASSSARAKQRMNKRKAPSGKARTGKAAVASA
ncbi:MAG: hypothetical protein WDN50_02440 [Bradyrhizobium sp.]